MFDNHTNERGQVGVGTLIVFIAMVLVAAIASGVLINAAGLLQTQSAQASQESSDQVSNRIQVIDSLGSDIDGDNETVGAVNLTVRLSPSANEINLENVTVQWTGPSGTYALTHDSTTDGDGSFTVSEIKDSDDSSPVLNSRDDRLRMNFDIDSFAQDSGGNPVNLAAGSSVELRITTDSGATTVVELLVPQSVAGESAVRL